MNPLCCIAPVSIDRDRNNSDVVKPPTQQRQLGLESSVKNVNFGSKPSFSTQASSVVTDFDGLSVAVNHEVDDIVIEPRDSKVFYGNGGVSGSVAGILYKWVNYGKGWRSRWFVLEDGVLSYYKIHGPDKIVMSPSREKGVKVIGEESLRYMKKANWSSNRLGAAAKQWKPSGEIHLKVSSIRASKSDDKRLSIFTGTKTLHLRCLSREDRAAWIEALLAAKDQFPRVLTNNDLLPSEDIVVSTEKLRLRLSQEGIGEGVIKDCESIMLCELSELQNQLKALQHKHIVLLDRLRQLETEKIELETTVVDETKERKSFCVDGNRRYSDFYSIMSEGSASDSDADNESRDGVFVDTDEEDGIYFDTNEFLSSESLRSASYRGRENMGNTCSPLIYDKESLYSDCSQDVSMEIKPIEYPYIKRRDSLPEPKERDKPVGLWSIIKDNIGKDLSGVCLPVYFNEPLSSLQKCFEDLEYSYLVDRALEWGKQGNDLMRILNIAAFAVSGYASTEGRQCKPFNPLLGETYEADYPDKGLRFFSEKVSHHPMVVACHCEGRGWKFWADSNLKGKFWGRSIQLDPVGVLTLQFEDGETFQWSKVTTSIYNIILGKIYCDHYGTMRIKGSGNYSCKLKFKEQSIIDRNPHQVHGFVHDNRTGEKVAMLVGKWDEAMYYVLGDPTAKPKGYDPMIEAVLLWERDKSVTKTRYNLTPFAISLNELTPGLLEKLPPTDSRLRPDQRHLENGEYELANAEKLRLEQLQRQARKLQERGWQPRWFCRDKEDGCYHYVGGYWETRERGNWEGFSDIFVDQFRKSFDETSSTMPQQESTPLSTEDSTSGVISEVTVTNLQVQSSEEASTSLHPISCENQVKSKLLCPLCRGQITGWIVEEPARHFMNAKSRSCACEACDFSGTYTDLRKHARTEHPCVRPSEADPERQRNWRRLERQRDLGDLISTLQSSIGEERSEDSILSFDEGGWLTVFFLIRVFRPGSSLRSSSWSGTSRARAREQVTVRRRSTRLWGEETHDGETVSVSREDDHDSSDGGSDSLRPRQRIRRQQTPDNEL